MACYALIFIATVVIDQTRGEAPTACYLAFNASVFLVCLQHRSITGSSSAVAAAMSFGWIFWVSCTLMFGQEHASPDDTVAPYVSCVCRAALMLLYFRKDIWYAGNAFTLLQSLLFLGAWAGGVRSGDLTSNLVKVSAYCIMGVIYKRRCKDSQCNTVGDLTRKWFAFYASTQYALFCSLGFVAFIFTIHACLVTLEPRLSEKYAHPFKAKKSSGSTGEFPSYGESGSVIVDIKSFAKEQPVFLEPDETHAYKKRPVDLAVYADKSDPKTLLKTALENGDRNVTQNDNNEKSEQSLKKSKVPKKLKKCSKLDKGIGKPS